MIRKFLDELTSPDADPTDDGNSDNGDPAPFVPPKTEVMRLLDHNEGTMWQSDLVTEFGWSAAKTSRHLSAMEEDGQIDRTKVGRRKVVFVPGKGPTETWDEQERVVEPHHDDT